MRNVNEQDIKYAYFAGIIDNKGSVSIGLDNYGNKQYYYEQYRVTGELSLLEKLKGEFGGSISANGQNCKVIWRITADRALEMFEKIRPFVSRRTKLIDHCILFGKNRSDIAKEVGKPSHENNKIGLIEMAHRFRTNMKVAEEFVMIQLPEELRIAYNEGALEAFSNNQEVN